MRVLVTGATGFVGQAVCEALVARGTEVIAGARAPDRPVPPGTRRADLGELGPETDFAAGLKGVEAVVHLAARVHQMRDASPDPLAAHRRVNRDATLALARAAAAAGVRRMVFVSSVKVMGEERERPYGPEDAPAPVDPYGLSKWEAEQGLALLAKETGLDVVVLRPPLVYGPGVRANFLKLVELVDRGIPLPFGAVRNRRSLVFVGNLADAIRVSAEGHARGSAPHFVADGEDLSTPELVRRLAGALGKPARLVPVPPSWMSAGLQVLGKQALARRLLGSLAVDAEAFRRGAAWTPPFSVDAGLATTVDWYRGIRRLAGRR